MSSKQNDLTENQDSICPTCKGNLLKHSNVQLITCAQNEITEHSIGIETKHQKTACKEVKFSLTESFLEEP